MLNVELQMSVQFAVVRTRIVNAWLAPALSITSTCSWANMPAKLGACHLRMARPPDNDKGGPAAAAEPVWFKIAATFLSHEIEI